MNKSTNFHEFWSKALRGVGKMVTWSMKFNEISEGHIFEWKLLYEKPSCHMVIESSMKNSANFHEYRSIV